MCAGVIYRYRSLAKDKILILPFSNYLKVSSTRLKHMKLKLRLVKDETVIFEMPLTMEEWPKRHLENELASFEQEHEKFAKLFDALSHQTRLRMMTRLFEHDDRTLSFAEFMRDLDLNPKIVWESTRKLAEGGLLIKSADGRYRCSEHGTAEFLMVSLALRRLLKAMEDL